MFSVMLEKRIHLFYHLLKLFCVANTKQQVLAVVFADDITRMLFWETCIVMLLCSLFFLQQGQ